MKKWHVFTHIYNICRYLKKLNVYVHLNKLVNNLQYGQHSQKTYNYLFVFTTPTIIRLTCLTLPRKIPFLHHTILLQLATNHRSGPIKATTIYSSYKTHQNNILKVFAISRERHTNSENPSASCVFLICLYCGM